MSIKARRVHQLNHGYSYIADPDYGWDRVCEQRFGTHPAQVFFAWNAATHVQDNEQSPEKRPFTKQELQDFFDHADDQVTLIANSKKKGWLPAYRDSVMFKVAYSVTVTATDVRRKKTASGTTPPPNVVELNKSVRPQRARVITDGTD